MRFDDPVFLFLFLPGLLTLYYLTVAFGSLPWRAAPRLSRIFTTMLLLAASLAFIREAGAPLPFLGCAVLGYLAARIIERRTSHNADPTARALLLVAVGGALVAFAFSRLTLDLRIAPLGGAVVACLAVAYVFDVFRDEAETSRPLTAALYLVQLPLLAAGPIVRYREFCTQLARRGVGMGAFAYGVRRVVIGLLKVVVIARMLGGPVDEILALPAGRLDAVAAWLGAVGFALQVYFQFSGYSDIAIGLGRMLGFRYPENFRRPYTADSVREFWRRWNITLITWLRDYFHLPIAGRDRPTPRLAVNVAFGFSLVGLWHGAGSTVLVWALYSSFWLALEAVGLEAWVRRLPTVVRHVYLLLVVTVGWVLFRADSLAHAAAWLAALGGLNGWSHLGVGDYMTTWSWAVLAVAVLGAGPLVPWISRWRVTVDAATVSLMMMLAATGVFLWLGVVLIVNAVRPARWSQSKASGTPTPAR